MKGKNNPLPVKYRLNGQLVAIGETTYGSSPVDKALMNYTGPINSA
jgi:hypothetical protein